jgi:hypothetical protein
VTVRVWEMAVALFGAAIAFVLVFGGAIIEGVVLGSLSGYWLLGRARVPEDLGARFLHRKALAELLKALALSLVMLAVLATIVVASLLGWNRDPEGPLLFAALLGVTVLLKRDLEDRIVRIDRFERGGDAEIAVAHALATLPAGWSVEHNLLRGDGYGNVDHVVTRPDGECFVIETKSTGYRSRYLGQTVSCAIAVKKQRRLRWVSPVLCIDDPEQIPEERRLGRARVWLVDRRQLADWLLTASTTRSW